MWLQVFSFKLRGAYNKMASLTPEQRLKGVICSSAGNHAQGVALAAMKLVCINAAKTLRRSAFCIIVKVYALPKPHA